MNNIEFKYNELLLKKDEIINDLDNDIEEKKLLVKFKDFCNCCYSLKEWSRLSLSDISSSVYIDICRGVNNGDKHVKINQNLNSYNSAFYRTSVNVDSPTIQSSTGGYIGDDNNPLYTNPGIDKLVAETEDRVCGIRTIIIESVKNWESILKSNNLL